MNKSYIVQVTDENMRLDRFLRSKLGKIPQSLIEKNLRSGKIKLNKKRVKSSVKVKRDDNIDLLNFNFKHSIIQKKQKFVPTNEILKAKSWPIFSCILTSRISLRGGFYDCYVQKILGNYLL